VELTIPPAIDPGKPAAPLALLNVTGTSVAQMVLRGMMYALAIYWYGGLAAMLIFRPGGQRVAVMSPR
jgi:hypothetical protein